MEPAGGAEAARRRAAEARRAARRASGERRRSERIEVRRFTRRSRHRRAAWVTAGAVAVLLGSSVAVAVFSPLLSLEQIEVEGTARVDAVEVQAAVSGQLGTPLARIDFERITTELEQFPLIASYVTETAPPHTLVIRVTERQPIATVSSGDGFDLVDPAGVVVQRLDDRQEGVPLVDVGGAPLDGTAFRSTAEVLLALPQALRQTVDSATASTADDVTLSLSTGERVVWGSADDSAEKAQVLAGLIADQARRDPAASVEFDVSAPDNGIIRTR
ncbi:FtsQ-type POTRA domain-containing protein [Frigoribacterium sp. ACAM 257]|nr:FtsQ-type POTRA domain-containing protein [Frigoribacterium sp. ACAM 257]